MCLLELAESAAGRVVLLQLLTHWGRVTHICVSKLTWPAPSHYLNQWWIIVNWTLGTNFSEILIEILIFSFKKMRLKVSSAKRRPFCLGCSVLIYAWWSSRHGGLGCHAPMGQKCEAFKSWRHMMTSSNGNIFRVTGLLCGEFTGHRWIPRTKASDANFDVFFELRLNKQLSKQSWGWWFETPSCSLWHQCNDYETTWQHAVYLVNDVTIYFCDFDIYCLALKRFSQMYQLRRYILLLLQHFWLLLILSLLKKTLVCFCRVFITTYSKSYTITCLILFLASCPNYIH